MHWRRKWQPTPVFLPGESQGQGAWWAAVYVVAQSRTQLKRLSSSSNDNPVCETAKETQMYRTDFLDSMGEGEGVMIWENGIETCTIM